MSAAIQRLFACDCACCPWWSLGGLYEGLPCQNGAGQIVIMCGGRL